MARFARTLVGVAAGVALTFAAATPAAADVHTLAYPTCNGASWAVFNDTNRWRFTPRYNGSPECVLRAGNFDNWGVVALQNALIKCANQIIKRDGDFGGETREAVIRVQRITGVTVDGIYGPETRDAMPWPDYAKAGNLDAYGRCDT